METWFKALFSGLVLATLAVLALIGINEYQPILEPLVERYTGMSDASLAGIILLVFLVGFALAFRTDAEEVDDIVHRGRKIFSSPNDRIKPAIDQNEIEEVEFVQEAYIAYLQDRTRDLDDTRPITLRIKLHPPAQSGELMFFRKASQIQRDTLLYYMEKLKRFDNFKYVVFVDWFNRFLFFAKADALRKEIEPIDGSHFIDLMNNYRIQELSDLPMFNGNWVSNHASNIKTLKLMAKKEVSEVMLVAHTWGRRYVGVVELNKLLHKMLSPRRERAGLHPLMHREHQPKEPTNSLKDMGETSGPKDGSDQTRAA